MRQISINSRHFYLWNLWIKIIFDIKMEIGIYLKYQTKSNIKKILNGFAIGTISDLTDGKVFIKVILDIKIKTRIFEMKNVQNIFN